MAENKKLFVSVPMRGRSEEDIKTSIYKMHKIAEIILDQDLDLIESFSEYKPSEDHRQEIDLLGDAIKKLSTADYMIGLYEIDGFAGCIIERDVALRYGIPYVRAFAEQVAADLLKQSE